VLDGVIEDERTFYYLAELDDQNEFDQPEMWIKANPNLGVSIKLTDMIEDWKKAKRTPAERNDFITKRFNLFVNSSEQAFLDFEVIKRNNKILDIESLRGHPCVGGFDLSQTEDFTSACLEFPLSSGEVFVLSHSWVPRKKIMLNNEKIPYETLENDGLLTICEKDYVEYEDVEDWFIQQSKQFNIELITYDPANAYRLVNNLENKGFKTLAVRQGFLTLSPALKDVKELFLDGKVIFNKNKLFQWYLNNVKLVEDRNGNWLPTKQGRYRKIDGFAAFLNAHTEVMKKMVNPVGNGSVEVISVKDLLK
ncbi:MAG: terminase large subunit, partial [Bacillales bacterium]|nr:terminase large subunit [Bacillales bacterium]